MKVLIVVPTLATFPFLCELVKTLSIQGHDVHWASSSFRFENFEQQLTQLTYHPIELPRGANPWGHWKASKQLRKLVAELKPDVIDVHFSAAMLTTALAIKSDWPPTMATVQGLRFTMQTGIKRWIEQAVETWAARKMDRTVVLTPDDFSALHPYSPQTVQLARSAGFGCDLEKFQPAAISQISRDAAAKQAGLKPNEIVLSFVGRKVAFKGFDLVLRAFLKAQRQLPHLRLIVCGNADPFHPSGLTPEEETELANHPQISQLGWIDRVADFLAISDIALFPSHREGMPVNLMESIAMGVPVITSNSRGCRDVVQHEITGIVLPDHDVDHFAEAIIRLSNDVDLRQKLSNHALATRQRFDRRIFVEEQINAYRELVAQQD